MNWNISVEGAEGIQENADSASFPCSAESRGEQAHPI